MVWRLLMMLAIGTLLIGCGLTATPAATPAVSQPTAALATAAPTTAASAQPTVAPATAAPTTAASAQPTVAPATAAPTSGPAQAGVLPAPLYVLQAGQVVRIDTDGTTKTTLTNESPFAQGALAITDLAVSPTDGALAYVLQGTNGNALVLTDANGQNRRVLVENVSVSTPRWSPDGSAVAVQILEAIGSTSSWKGGVWVFSGLSGEARQLIANDRPPEDGASEAWGYAPDAWAPDGSKLLVSRFSQVVEICDAAILNVNTGELTTFQVPEGGTPPLRVQCAGGVWAADSSGVYVVLRGPGISPAEPGLYLANATSGALVQAIPTQTAEGKFVLVQAQAARPDGTLYALVAVVDGIPDISIDPNARPPSVSLYRVGQNGMLELLRQESFVLYGTPIWAPGGAGAVIAMGTNDGSVAYAYVPVSGEVVPLQIEPTAGIAWGR